MVIPAGAIGNDRPVLTKREFWYSPKLGVNLISKRQERDSVLRILSSQISSSASLTRSCFELPVGSKVIDLRKETQLPASQAQAPN